MAWFAVDDRLHSHPKARAAGLEAIGLFTIAGTYCMDYLTDGHVPEWLVTSWPKGRALAKRLVDVRLWETTDVGWRFASWAEYQRSLEDIERDRAKARERMRRLREQRKNHPEPGTEHTP